MKIICMVKFVPDVDKFLFDFESNTVDRKNVRMIINPDDVCGVGFALAIKAKQPDTNVEVVTMGPKNIMPMINDLVRVGVDKVHMISDSCFAGSDSYATATILGTLLKSLTYDCIVTGTHAIDGDTSHVPGQIAEILNLGQMSNVIKIEDNLNERKAIITVDDEKSICTYEMAMPGVISIIKESNYKMPYIKKENMDVDVKDSIHMITNKELGIDVNHIGIKGSLTKVNRTFIKEYELRDKLIMTNDHDGIEHVYQFLKTHGYIDGQGV